VQQNHNIHLQHRNYSNLNINRPTTQHTENSNKSCNHTEHTCIAVTENRVVVPSTIYVHTLRTTERRRVKRT